MKIQNPDFFIAEIPIYGDTILAPMDGYTDSPFRIIAKRFGSAVTITEFINAIDILGNRKYFQAKTRFSDIERPIGFQIFDDNPTRIIKAAYVLGEKKPDFFDINLGCSARKVANRGAGAALLKEPKKIAEIISGLCKEIKIPITAKIRLGWDETSLNYLEVARIIEDNGGKMVSIHGRTSTQSFMGDSNWKAIAEIKSHLKIPVIGNGDIKNASQIDKMKNETGVDGIMIGRAAIGNPWVFSRKDGINIKKAEIIDVIIEHLQMMIDFYDPRLGLIRFRKILKKYLQTLLLPADLIHLLLKSEDPDQIIGLLKSL